MSLSVFLIPAAIGVAAVAVDVAKVEEDTSFAKDEVYYKLETKIKDEQLLQATLKNYGSEAEVDNEEVSSRVGDTDITFIKDKKGTYQAYFHESIALRDAEEFLESIYEEYTRIVQRKTYEKLKERAGNEGLIFESEETNEEESIVLTFQVKE